jgi:hypothetical protein
MVNLTIAVDERILERARSRATQQGTFLDALVRSYVESFASGEESREQAVKALLDLSRQTKSGSGGRRWTRAELHER